MIKNRKIVLTYGTVLVATILLVSRSIYLKEWRFSEKNDNVILNLLKPPSSGPYNLREKDPFYMEIAHGVSWSSIHNFTLTLFKNQKFGFFIEAGALDGEQLSNSLWLEKENKWTGLLVEPNPSSFKEILKKNRKCWKINTCLSTTGYRKKHIFRVPIINGAEVENEYSWALRGLSSIITDWQISRTDGSSYYSSIECLPIGSILKALKQTTIDFLSLDIETGELKILKTFPWETVYLKSLVVEYSTNRSKLIDFIISKGFIFLGENFYRDLFFVHKNAFGDQFVLQLKKQLIESRNIEINNYKFNTGILNKIKVSSNAINPN